MRAFRKFVRAGWADPGQGDAAVETELVSYDGKGGAGFTNSSGLYKVGTSWLTLAQLQALPTDPVALANVLAANPTVAQGSRAYAIAEGVADLSRTPSLQRCRPQATNCSLKPRGITAIGSVTIGAVGQEVQGQGLRRRWDPVDVPTPPPGANAPALRSLDVHFIFNMMSSSAAAR